MGTVNIWDYVAGGADYSYNMVALSNFRATPVPALGLGADDAPTLADSDTNGAYLPIDAVNYVLMKDRMITLYDIRSWLGGQSDVIVAFPTKRQTLGTRRSSESISTGSRFFCMRMEHYLLRARSGWILG